jgi:hypothetical protein
VRFGQIKNVVSNQEIVLEDEKQKTSKLETIASQYGIDMSKVKSGELDKEPSPVKETSAKEF